MEDNRLKRKSEDAQSTIDELIQEIDQLEKDLGEAKSKIEGLEEENEELKNK